MIILEERELPEYGLPISLEPGYVLIFGQP